MEWIYSRAIAHRGLHNGIIPENSLAAFSKAIEADCPIELDLQLLSDGNLAVFHDRDLQRMTGVVGKIAEQTASSIKNLRLLDTRETIPLLEDVLELVGGKIPILIEIKNEHKVGKLEENLWKKLQNYSGSYAIQSFNPYSLGWFREKDPKIIRGQLATGFHQMKEGPWDKKFILSHLLLNWVSQPHFIAYDLRSLPNLPTAIAKKVFTVPIVAWTVRTEAEKQHALRYADNIIFEQVS